MIDESTQTVPVVQALPVDEALRNKVPAASTGSKRVYSHGANRRHQRKSTDLIPKRVRSCTLAVLLLAGLVGLLNYLAIHAPSWRAVIGDAGVDALAISGAGTLSAWLCSFLFMLATITSCQVYSLRKHRCDDYRGSYRIWSWLAVVLLISSACCIADLGGLVLHVVAYASSGSLTGGSLPPFTVAIWLMISALAIRVMFEVNVSRTALGLVLLAWFAYSSVTAMTLPVAEDLLARQSMLTIKPHWIIGNGLLVGATAVLLATSTYARCIYLVAHGLIKLKVRQPKPAKKPAVKKKAKTKPVAKRKAAKATPGKSKPAVAKTSKTTKQAKPAKTSKPATKNAPAAEPERVAPLQSRLKGKGKASQKSAAADDSQSEAFDDVESVISMSKADRRRQRKIEKRQRRAA